jgi:hypothetical protein
MARSVVCEQITQFWRVAGGVNSGGDDLSGASLDARRGHRPPPRPHPRRPVLATILHQRLALPQVAIAALFSVRPETINKRIRDIRQLLEQAGHIIQPGRTGSQAWAIFTSSRPDQGGG